MWKFIAAWWILTEVATGGGATPKESSEAVRQQDTPRRVEQLAQADTPASRADVRHACLEMDREFAEADTLVEQARAAIAQLDDPEASVPWAVRNCVDAVGYFNVLRHDACGNESLDRFIWADLARRMLHAKQACQALAAGGG